VVTRKLELKYKIDVTQYCKDFTGLYHELYFGFEESEDKKFQAEMREKYGIDSWIYQSCKTEVKVKLKQFETDTAKKTEQLELLSAITEFDSKRHKYKVMQKICYLKNNIGKDIIFGGKSNLRRITFLSNPIKSRKQKHKRINKRQLKKAKSKYQSNRLILLSIIGESPQKSNRKFDFDLTNKKLTFKPKQGERIELEFYCSDNIYKELCALQEQIGEQSISVKLNNNNVWLTYDEEKLSGFNFNESEYFKELKMIPKDDKEARKECYKKHIKEQEERKLKNKIKNRYIAFDLNPEYIGIVIIDDISGDGNEFKIIRKECISFANLNTKLRLSSSDKKQIKQNNKRIHELNCAWKYISNLIKHYKVANVVVEDLNFKQKLINQNPSEVNRKTLNIWHRTRTTNLIQKYCNTIGLKLIEVNACYSSFIGNIKHGFFDPVNAAIEIARRGITKFIAKSGFYQTLEKSDLDTMYRLGLDVQNKTISTWVEAYKLFVKSKLRYRLELQDCNFLENNLRSHKSCTISYIF